jgi:N-acetylglucosaminyldiphosphoundecaprenol N-acetyl-beta-D-mannosaminyltransferase
MPDITRSAVRRESFGVLGTQVEALQIPDVIRQMEMWICQRDQSHFVAVTNVHVVMEARHDAYFRRVLDSADLRVPDGMPLIWVGRLRGHSLPRRVYGPDLLLDFCRETHEKSYRHFFYGGAPGVSHALGERLRARFPHLKIAGAYSPPFRRLTPQEDAMQIAMINQAAPDVLWVGLGCPKQERWIYEHRHLLHVPVAVGVGQAFDIHSGRSKQAPNWLREHGFEWLYRLAAEPRRLWRRYLVYNSKFMICESLELLGLNWFR